MTGALTTALLRAAGGLALLLAGSYVAAVMSAARDAAGSTRRIRDALLDPLRHGALLVLQETATTERPDPWLWALAPALYAAVAGCALTVVPLGRSFALADVTAGIVLFGAAEACAIVAVFLHGWAPSSHLALVGGFRFVALGLSYELLSMFVLIAASLPAGSLRVSAIVEAQDTLWNVVRQPLGLPLWTLVTLGVTFTGPLDVADGVDLAGGTSIEASGRHLLLWKVARGAMLAVFSAMGAATLLGGWNGPVLPGWAWIAIKTTLLMALTVWVAGCVGRLPVERAVTLAWTVVLPIAFLHLLLAGLEALP